jgi:ATP-dependent Lon protease
LRLAIDASHVIWIATCNDPNAVEPAMRSRFQHIRVAQPTPEQIEAVVHSVHETLRQEFDWARAFDPQLDAGVVARLSDMSPRQMRRALEVGHARAAWDGRRRIRPEDLPDLHDSKRRRIGFIDHN